MKIRREKFSMQENKKIQYKKEKRKLKGAKEKEHSEK